MIFTIIYIAVSLMLPVLLGRFISSDKNVEISTGIIKLSGRSEQNEFVNNNKESVLRYLLEFFASLLFVLGLGVLTIFSYGALIGVCHVFYSWTALNSTHGNYIRKRLQN